MLIRANDRSDGGDIADATCRVQQLIRWLEAEAAARRRGGDDLEACLDPASGITPLRRFGGSARSRRDAA